MLRCHFDNAKIPKHIDWKKDMSWQQRIVCDPKILAGKPCVKGTRISVELILGWLSADWNIEQLLDSYPNITREDVLAALAYAHELLHEDGILPLAETAA